MYVTAKYKEMVLPGEFVLDGVMKDVYQLDEEKAKEVNEGIAKGWKHVKTILCNCCKIRSATIEGEKELLCSSCKSRKDLGL